MQVKCECGNTESFLEIKWFLRLLCRWQCRLVVLKIAKVSLVLHVSTIKKKILDTIPSFLFYYYFFLPWRKSVLLSEITVRQW